MAYSKDEYYYRQMMAQSNTPFSMGGYKTHPLDGVDIKSIPMDELNLMLDVIAKEHDRRTRHTPLKGPTKAELESDEALRNAWEAYEIVRNLKGKK